MKIRITDKSTDAEKLQFVDRLFKDKSKAGKISAAKLTPEERRLRAKAAVAARERIRKEIKEKYAGK